MVKIVLSKIVLSKIVSTQNYKLVFSDDAQIVGTVQQGSVQLNELYEEKIVLTTL